MDSMRMLRIILLFLVPIVAQGQKRDFFMYNKTSIVPLIIENGTLTPFSTNQGTASGDQTFQVTSNNQLLANVVINALSGYEFSLNGTTWFTSLTLTVSGGSVSGQPVLVHVRLTASAAAGNYPGPIQLTSSGANTVNITATGTVTALTGNDTVQVHMFANVPFGNAAWNDVFLNDLGGANDTVQSGALKYSNGGSSPWKFFLGTGNNADANGFYTDNGSGWASATTSGYPPAVFREPYLFTSGATTESDTLTFTNLTAATNNYTLDIISSRSTATDRPQTFTVNGVTIPLNARNNINTVLRWTNVPRDGNNQIKVIITYTGSFSFVNAFRLINNH